MASYGVPSGGRRKRGSKASVHITRREALAASAAIASGLLGVHTASGQTADEDIPGWQICVDMPLYDERPGAAPLTETPPVEMALPQSERLQGLPSDPDVAMGLPGADLSQPTEPLQIAIQKAKDWTPDSDGVVRLSVSFVSTANDRQQNYRDERLQARVRDLAAEWSRIVAVDFDFSPGMNATGTDIAIGFGSNDGHWSMVGSDSRSSRTKPNSMNLDLTRDTIDSPNDNFYNRGVVMHEFGHALGAIHEHSSRNSKIHFDPEACYAYFARIRWTKAMVDFNVLKRYTDQELLIFSEFDPDSIMLYRFPREILMPDTPPTHSNSKLSRNDILFMQKVYRPRGIVDPRIDTTTPTTTNPTIPSDQGILSLGVPHAARIGAPGQIDVHQFHINTAGNYTIRTLGNTVLRLQLNSKGGQAFGLLSDVSPDLTNRLIMATLSPGDYTVSAAHVLPTGIGEYLITLTAGSF